MKKTTFVLILLVAGVIGMTSCKKEDSGDGSGAGGTMTLKIDGSSWSASLKVAASYSGGVLSVTGSDSNAKQCNITLTNISGTGTFDIGGSMTNPNSGRWTQGLGTNDTYMTQLGLGSGTCTITELSATQVKGTFSFTAKNTPGIMVTITEGSFTADL